MESDVDLAKMVRHAQQGHADSLDRLAREVRPRVMVYLYRMTLDHHLAQDLTQETMLTLIKSLQHLKTDSHSSLWAWIYRTALGKGQHYFHKQGRRQNRRPTTVDHEILDQLEAHSMPDGLDHAQRGELIEAMSDSLETLKTTYRHVLVLRCFEQLSFAQIAIVLGGGSELRARLLFMRAKRALQRQLHNRGFGPRYFLSGLTGFALVTGLRSKSTAAIPAVTAEVVGAGAVGLVATPCGIGVVVVAILALTAGSALVRGPTSAVPKVSEPVPWGFASQLIGVHDPDGDGWERLIPFDGRPDLYVPIDPNSILEKPGANTFLILPERHWVELGFPGVLVDGPGPDIEYYCLKTDNLPPIYLTDANGRSHRLLNPQSELLQNWAYRVTFDLAHCQCPFIPTAIRIEGVGPPTQPDPLIWMNLKARVVPSDV